MKLGRISRLGEEMGILDIDGGFMRTLGKIVDIMLLGLLVFITSIPIFTIGASVTACFTLTMKMSQDKEGHITKAYFKAFKQNFAKSTGLWAIVLIFFGIILADFWALTKVEISYVPVVQGGLWFLLFIVVFTINYIFSLQAKYENTIIVTLKNAFFLSFIHIFKSLLIALITIVPIFMLYVIPKWYPFIVWLAIPTVCYFNSMILIGIYSKMDSEE